MESEGNVGGSDPVAPVGGAPTAPTGLSSPSSTTPTQPTAGSGGRHTLVHTTKCMRTQAIVESKMQIL